MYIALVPSRAIYILPWLQGNIRNIALHWPLIRPRKVVYGITRFFLWEFIFALFASDVEPTKIVK